MAGMIVHQYERNAYLALYLLQLGEKQTEAHAIAQGTGRGCLYDGTVGERVAERHAYFYHVNSVALERTYDFGGAGGRWVAGAKVY